MHARFIAAGIDRYIHTEFMYELEKYLTGCMVGTSYFDIFGTIRVG